LAGEARITTLEQADDIVLLATSPKALQEKLEGMLHWYQVNFMEINSTKSVVMILGKKPRACTTRFSLGRDRGPLAVVDTQLYLGFKLSSKGLELLRVHYDAKKTRHSK
jgi:hypothetical protein